MSYPSSYLKNIGWFFDEADVDRCITSKLIEGRVTQSRTELLQTWADSMYTQYPYCGCPHDCCGCPSSRYGLVEVTDSGYKISIVEIINV